MHGKRCAAVVGVQTRSPALLTPTHNVKRGADEERSASERCLHEAKSGRWEGGRRKAAPTGGHLCDVDGAEPGFD
jgi:hypothetical protein